MSQANVDRALELLDAFNGRDLDAFVALADDAIEVESRLVAMEGGYHGHAEATITLHTHGFDPGLGILHTDKRYRGSLAHDLMEPVRPVVDGMVLELLAEHALESGDVYETREAVCRLGPCMARRLARWAPALRPPLEAHASEIAALLLGGRSTRPQRRRNATTAGKGSKRRLAGRASP